MINGNLLGSSAPIGEILLAETAIRIELPPSLHRLAVERYEALRKYIERDASPLAGRVRIFYPQGSMAIRATIRSRKREEGFDIDIVAELILPLGTAPGAVLDLLFAAINGEKGSLYHGKVERNTRCVTIHYEDGMHLDITPSLLVDEYDPRMSVIFHAKAEERPAAHRRLEMNSYAFVECSTRARRSTFPSSRRMRRRRMRSIIASVPTPTSSLCPRTPATTVASRRPSSRCSSSSATAT
jgi:hypothetical protein